MGISDPGNCLAITDVNVASYATDICLAGEMCSGACFPQGNMSDCDIVLEVKLQMPSLLS